MRNTGEENIDKLFQDNLNSGAPEYSEELWNDLEQKLDKTHPAKKSFNSMQLVLAGVIAGLLLLNGWLFVSLTQEQKAHEALDAEMQQLKVEQALIPQEADAALIDHAAVETEISKPSVKGMEAKQPEQVNEVASTVNAEEETSEPVEELVTVTEEPLTADKAEIKVEEPETVEEAKTSEKVQAKYYVVKDGQIIPVKEIDHPGAETGDSIH